MMKVIGIICLIIIAIFIIIWLFRRLSITKKYARTTGEIISVKNIMPLVDKRQVGIRENYVYTNCKYQGDVHATVRFIDRNGEEISRRYSSSEPFVIKINEYKQTVPQYTCVFPEWQIGKRVKIFYDPIDTTDIFIGKAPRHK